MKTLHLWLILALVLALTTFVSSGHAGETAAAFVERVNKKIGGIPDEAEAKFFSPEFQEYFRLAREENARAPKDIKPNYADYLVFSPHPDAPASTRIIASQATDPKHPIPVIIEFTYEWEGKRTSAFSIVYVKAHESSWQIVDVVHLGGPGPGFSVRNDFRENFPEVRKAFSGSSDSE